MAPQPAAGGRGTRPERNLVARPVPARLAAAADDVISDDQHMEQAVVLREGKGALGPVDITVAVARTASAMVRAVGAGGPRPERTGGARAGPARLAAAADAATGVGQETVPAPQTSDGQILKQPPALQEEEDVRRVAEVDAETAGAALRGTRPERTPVT
jgi:hypothetical protein